MDTAALLTEQPLPAGRRLAVIGNAGGLGVIAADQAHGQGLEVTPLGEESRQRLIASCGDVAGVGNPVDLGAAATAQGFREGVAALVAESSVDAVVVHVVATAVADVHALVSAVDEAVRADHRKPVALVVTGAHAPAAEGGATRFSTGRAALRAIARSASYAAWKARNADTALDAEHLPRVPAARRGTPGWVEPLESMRYMEGHGIRVVRQSVVQTPSDAAAEARRIGFPVVVKTAVSAVVHKVEDGLVKTGLDNSAAVAEAAAAVMEKVAGPALVQRQLKGPEIALGIVRDAGLGPLIMVASGGTLLSLWADQQFLLPPVDRRDAEAALANLRTWPLLTGYRGEPAVDVGAIADLIVRVGDFAIDRPDVVELDLNPVILTPDGPCCVDVKLRLGP